MGTCVSDVDASRQACKHELFMDRKQGAKHIVKSLTRQNWLDDDTRRTA